MCGIAGYVGPREAVPVVLDQLRRLEYRGYDSAGVATVNGEIRVVKASGRLAELEALLADPPQANLAVAHTRWATHGGPTTENAHPHLDCGGEIVVCHNGIIENYAALRRELQSRGHRFRSETDTEVLPHLIEECFDGDLEAAVRRALLQVRGSYAVLAAARRDPGRIVAARRDSPLIVGIAEGECFVASDIPALLPYTREVLALEDGETAVLSRGGTRVTGVSGRPADRLPFRVTWDAQAAEKDGYEHFMLKEIREQPRALRETLRGRLEGDAVRIEEIEPLAARLAWADRVHLVGCGTAYHAGLVAGRNWESLLRVPVTAEIASEYRYRDPIVDERTLAIFVSQSGETADTLAALRLARARGAACVAVVNVVGSTLAREADAVVYTQAGPEICVASTKAYTSQLVALHLLGLDLARRRGRLDGSTARRSALALGRLPGQVEQVLVAMEGQDGAFRRFEKCRDFFFIGRGLDYAVAQEGALKLKEISYRHSEALAAGEMKHGTLALVTDEVTCVCLSTQPAMREKVIGNVREVRARGARVMGVVATDDQETPEHLDCVIRIPVTLPELAPVLAVVPLQIFAYHVARQAGCEIDRPRNLAKSVTVE